MYFSSYFLQIFHVYIIRQLSAGNRLLTDKIAKAETYTYCKSITILLRVCIYTRTHMRTHKHSHTHADTDVHTHTHTNRYTQTHTLERMVELK